MAKIHETPYRDDRYDQQKSVTSYETSVGSDKLIRTGAEAVLLLQALKLSGEGKLDGLVDALTYGLANDIQGAINARSDK